MGGFHFAYLWWWQWSTYGWRWVGGLGSLQCWWGRLPVALQFQERLRWRRRWQHFFLLAAARLGMLQSDGSSGVAGLGKSNSMMDDKGQRGAPIYRGKLRHAAQGFFDQIDSIFWVLSCSGWSLTQPRCAPRVWLGRHDGTAQTRGWRSGRWCGRRA
jgi:hypothetical protein